MSTVDEQVVPVLPATVQTPDWPLSALRMVVVDDPTHGQVNVLWRSGRRNIWRCSVCGRSPEASCVHTFAAALTLAEHLLGLRRVPNLNPAPADNRKDPA